MSSQLDSTGGDHRSGARETEQTDQGEEAPSPVICWMCQQPIERERHRRWRSEPVHYRCRSEFRYGVSEEPDDS